MAERPAADPVELTRRLFACADGGDIDGIMDAVDLDAVWDASSWGFGVYEGRRLIRRFLEDWIGSFEEFRRDSEEVVDLGGGVVYAVAVTRGRTRGGPEIRIRGATVCLWVDGLTKRVAFYQDPADGRAAAERLAEAGA